MRAATPGKNAGARERRGRRGQGRLRREATQSWEVAGFEAQLPLTRRGTSGKLLGGDEMK